MDPEPAGALQWVGRGVRYVVLLLTACIVSMFASFVLVRQLTPLVGPNLSADDADVEEAVRWRSMATELVQLTAEFNDVAAWTSDPSSEQYRARVSQGLLPRVNDLRRRLTSPAESDATDMTLLKAADQLAGAMARPGDEQLRLRAAEDVLAAVEEIETRIRVLGVGQRAGPVVDVSALHTGR
jgi:hypothetical protein